MAKKLRALSVLLAFVFLILSLLPATVQAEDEPAPCPGMSAFDLTGTTVRCTFSDVKASAWYYRAVAYAQTLGLIAGKTASSFAPNDTLTKAESAAIAVRVYARYYGLSETHTPDEGEAWYAPYLRTAVQYGILDEIPEQPGENVTRAEAARMLCRSLPEKELAPIKEHPAITDMDPSEPCYNEILTLYRAGVLVGTDRFGSFNPGGEIRRCEFASLLTALVTPSLRSGAPVVYATMERFDYDLSGAVNTFTDVPDGTWYSYYVSVQETIGLMSGMGNGMFAPDGTVSLAQAVSVAVRVYEKYCGLTPTAAGSGEQWYVPYIKAAKSYGILSRDFTNYKAAATRAEVVMLLYGSLHPQEYVQINDISSLPDLSEADDAYTAVMAFYRAGILSGMDEYGTFGGSSHIRRSELAVILSKLVVPSMRESYTLKERFFRTLTYGMSGSGKYPLTAYQIGDGENVMVLTFAIHGWEDHYNRDGQSLVYLANALKDYLMKNYNTVGTNDWTVYILPCLNPDGTYDGTSSNGLGRRTLYRYNENGALVYGGIDMNRSFPYAYEPMTGSRYYNGTQPLQCPEAQALAAFVQEVKGDGANVLIDTHGWYSQVIAKNVGGKLYQAYAAQFSDIGHCDNLRSGHGYFSAYCAFELGYDAALYELPQSVSSHAGFILSGAPARFCAVICNLLKTYIE